MSKRTQVFASESKTSDTPAQVTLAVVLRVKDGRLQVLLWERALAPDKGRWALPGGYLAAGESLEESIVRQLQEKVDVSEVAHLEQLGTWSSPKRHPEEWQLATAYLGLVPTDHEPKLPEDTRWHRVDKLPQTAFDHGDIVRAGVTRLRNKLSYTNLGFALAPKEFTLSELQRLYEAALAHAVSQTNLKRVLLRRGVLVSTGIRRSAGRAGGRPAELYRFRRRKLEVTDPFAAFAPPKKR